MGLVQGYDAASCGHLPMPGPVHSHQLVHRAEQKYLFFANAADAALHQNLLNVDRSKRWYKLDPVRSRMRLTMILIALANHSADLPKVLLNDLQCHGSTTLPSFSSTNASELFTHSRIESLTGQNNYNCWYRDLKAVASNSNLWSLISGAESVR